MSQTSALKQSHNLVGTITYISRCRVPPVVPVVGACRRVSVRIVVIPIGILLRVACSWKQYVWSAIGVNTIGIVARSLGPWVCGGRGERGSRSWRDVGWVVGRTEWKDGGRALAPTIQIEYVSEIPQVPIRGSEHRCRRRRTKIRIKTGG